MARFAYVLIIIDDDCCLKCKVVMVMRVTGY